MMITYQTPKISLLIDVSLKRSHPDIFQNFAKLSQNYIKLTDQCWITITLLLKYFK